MDAQLDLYPVSELGDRYSINRSNIYARLSKLGIEPEKVGSKAYLNADQMVRMDALDEHIKNGGSIATFVAEGDAYDRPIGQASLSRKTQDKPQQLEAETFVNAIVEQLAARLQPQSEVQTLPPAPASTSYLDALETLEKCSQHGWRLSTSQLAQLLGLKSLSGSEVKRYGFTFTRDGKNGSESAWRIEK